MYTANKIEQVLVTSLSSWPVLSCCILKLWRASAGPCFEAHTPENRQYGRCTRNDLASTHQREIVNATKTKRALPTARNPPFACCKPFHYLRAPPWLSSQRPSFAWLSPFDVSVSTGLLRIFPGNFQLIYSYQGSTLSLEGHFALSPVEVEGAMTAGRLVEAWESSCPRHTNSNIFRIYQTGAGCQVEFRPEGERGMLQA